MLMKPFRISNFLTLLILLGAVQNALSQQDTLTFIPKWTVGMERMAEVSEEIIIRENEVQTVDSTSEYSFRIHVASETDEFYIVHLEYKNVIYETAYQVFGDTVGSADEYNKLTLKYGVNKTTGSAKLMNWSQIKKRINITSEEIQDRVNKANPDRLVHCKMILTPVESIFLNEKSITSHMSDEVGFILFPFNKTYITGDTLMDVETIPNPFNPMGSLKQTTVSYLVDVKMSKQTCEIEAKEIVDLKQFEEMMRSMLKSMVDRLSGYAQSSDSVKKEAVKQIDEINLKYDIKSTRRINFDFKSYFPTQITTTKNIKVINQQESREVDSIVTITFK